MSSCCVDRAVGGIMVPTNKLGCLDDMYACWEALLFLPSPFGMIFDDCVSLWGRHVRCR